MMWIPFGTIGNECKLNSIDKQAEDMFFRLIKQIAERDGVTEQPKAKSQMN